MTVITFEGHHISTRTRDMLVEARRITKAELVVTQGGYNAGGVAASSGTHDRDAMDIGAEALSTAERAEAVLRLRQVGFAAWVRNPSQSNWPWHIHCIPIGGDVSAAAAAQVEAYKNGRNGLASNGKDDGPRLYIQTWETYLKRRGPLPPTDTPPKAGDDMPLTDAEWDKLRGIINDELNKQDRELWIQGTGKTEVIDRLKRVEDAVRGLSAPKA